ncbi:EGF and pentraxin domain-containing protein 1 (Polydom) [Durusdinium trenchii]|uniref:EGF and pentraxin domain-containing protein 1 (Polydom) n=1 Tax=Durusdinium trenchii TaxID=1381693 RepID=A0ABP0LKW8_9DINO
MGQRTPSYCMGWGSSERFLFPSFGTAPDALGRSPSVPSGPEDGFDPAPLFDAAGELKLHFVAEKYAGGGNTDLVEGPNRFGRVLEVRLDQFFWEGSMEEARIFRSMPLVHRAFKQLADHEPPMHFERHELHGNLMKGYHSGSLAVEPTPDTSGTVRFLVMTVRNNNKPAAIDSLRFEMILEPNGGIMFRSWNEDGGRAAELGLVSIAASYSQTEVKMSDCNVEWMKVYFNHQALRRHEAEAEEVEGGWADPVLNLETERSAAAHETLLLDLGVLGARPVCRRPRPDRRLRSRPFVRCVSRGPLGTKTCERWARALRGAAPSPPLGERGLLGAITAGERAPHAKVFIVCGAAAVVQSQNWLEWSEDWGGRSGLGEGEVQFGASMDVQEVPYEPSGGLKWYWFHLSAQVAFAIRELIATWAISDVFPERMAMGFESSATGVLQRLPMGSTDLELIFVNAAYWLTLAITIREARWDQCEPQADLKILFILAPVARSHFELVWCFSSVRQGKEAQKVAVDGLLDMLLLPVNIIFFCDVCVRALMLEPDSQLAQRLGDVSLPSFAPRFAALSRVGLRKNSVVEAEMASDRSSIRLRGWAFGWGGVRAPAGQLGCLAVVLLGASIPASMHEVLQGIQSDQPARKLTLRGVVAVYVPTFCYWASKSCMSCETWYEENVATALTAVTFLLCSFAIMFVFYFESGYRHQLEKTEPMWKFLGVKGIVSVTYFQWLVIEALASFWHWDESRMYLVHCLLYACWMPLLAMVHTFLAYPFYRFRNREPALWLVGWLETLRVSEAVEASQAEPEASQGELEVDPVAENGLADANVEAPSPVTDTREDETGHLSRTEGLLSDGRAMARSRGRSVERDPVSCKCLLTLIPAEKIELEEPLRNISCSGTYSCVDLHFALLNDTLGRWSPDRVGAFLTGSSPGVAGAWLPLCSSTLLGCAPGHFALEGAEPSLSCSAKGAYVWQGSCSAISCGAPPRLPHATPRMSDIKRQNWTYGVTVHYDCDKPGYWGSLSAHCNVTGTWLVEGACVEVTCNAPPSVPHAQPLWDPERGNVSTGMVIRYQCDEMYNGTPTASCGDDGMYMISGRCRRECGAPPRVLHAAPRFNNTEAKSGWFVGMRCPYVCDPGYQGYVTALCEEDGPNQGGNYSVSGHCAPVLCGTPPKLPQATARMEDVTKQNFSFGSLVHYDCKAPRFHGQLLATCLSTSRWEVNGTCVEVHCSAPPAVDHASPLGDQENVTAGTVIRYQCEEGYNGTVSAMCGYDSQYILLGRCRRECSDQLPAVPHAAPASSAGSAAPAVGWLAGMNVPYSCLHGYDGAVSAICGSDGNYSIVGQCQVASSVEARSLRSKLTGVSTAMGLENGLLFLGLGVLAYQRYRRVATPVVATNEMEGMSAPMTDA